MNTKKIILILCISVAILAIVILSLYKGYLRFNYPSHLEYPVQGIDVSHHQKVIDWSKIKEQNIRFVFVKATEGGDFKDSMFSTNWRLAMKNNLDVGAYHFFTFCKSGKEQANNFIKTVPKSPHSLPPVIDLEFGGNCTLQLDNSTILKEIDTLQNTLYKYYKKIPILYVTTEFYNQFLIGQFLENPIWIRDIYKKPSLDKDRKWTFWQYANRGHLDGIETYVDFNVFNGSNEEYGYWKSNY